MDRYNSAKKIQTWWRNIKEKEWGEILSNEYDSDHYLEHYLEHDLESYIINSLMNESDTDYKYDEEGRFYDHDKTYDIFGATLTAREYSDYVCANTRDDCRDYEYFTTTENPPGYNSYKEVC